MARLRARRRRARRRRSARAAATGGLGRPTASGDRRLRRRRRPDGHALSAARVGARPGRPRGRRSHRRGGRRRRHGGRRDGAPRRGARARSRVDAGPARRRARGQGRARGATGGEADPLAPTHTHFVLADSDEWGGETRAARGARRRAGARRAGRHGAGRRGRGARGEVARGGRAAWPVLVDRGHGRRRRRDRAPPPPAGRRAAATPSSARAARRDGRVASATSGGADGTRSGSPQARLGAAGRADPQGRMERCSRRTTRWRSRSRRTFERFQRCDPRARDRRDGRRARPRRGRMGGSGTWLHWGAVVTPIIVATLDRARQPARRPASGGSSCARRPRPSSPRSTATGRGRASTRRALARGEPRRRRREARLAARLEEIDAGLIQTAASGGAADAVQAARSRRRCTGPRPQTTA